MNFETSNKDGEPGAPLASAPNGAENNLDAEKPFGIVRYFSTIAIVLIFAAALVLAALISRRAEGIINARVEDDTTMLMENLNHQMFMRFLLPMALSGGVHLSNPEQYELLNSIILSTIHGFDTSRVTIYNLDGITVYSTDQDEVGQLVDDMGAYLEAIRIKSMPRTEQTEFDEAGGPADERAFLNRLKKETVNRREGDGYLFGDYFPHGDFSIRSFKALENYDGRSSLSGVLELKRDLTPEYREIARLQWFALGFAVFTTLLLTLVLQLVVSRGARIINQKNRERQKLQEQLDQAERLAGLGGMVATVAHEIRNPLGIIHSTADLLKDFLEKNPKEAKLAGAIVEEADRLSEVVTEFLDFARPPTPRLTPTVVEDVLEEILAFLELTCARAGVECRKKFRDIQTPTPADPGMLHRAFLNLMINAIQAMPEGGLLSVSTEEESGRLKISVGDSGPGLSKEAREKIFSPFYTTKAKGSGLGLVIVRNIVIGHGGEISLAPENAGGDVPSGLTVVISLPLA